MPETYDPVLIGKLLERAGHHRTQDDVALAAIRKACEILDRQGRSLRDVVQPIAPAVEGDFLGHLNEILVQVKETEDENRELRQQVSDLKNRLTLSSPTSNYARLRQVVLARKNVGVYWRDLFMKSTGFDDYSMKRWKVEDKVPEEAFAAAAQIDPSGYERPAARSWTYAENSLFRKLFRENKSSFQIASQMSEQFGRIFSIDGITKKMRILQR